MKTEDKINILPDLDAFGTPEFDLGGAIVPRSVSVGRTEKQKRMLEQHEEHLLADDLTHDLAVHGSRVIADANVIINREYNRVVETILARVMAYHGTPAQDFIEKFAEKQLNLYAVQMLGVSQLTDKLVKQIMVMSPFVKEVEEKVGFFARLFGRRE